MLYLLDIKTPIVNNTIKIRLLLLLLTLSFFGTAITIRRSVTKDIMLKLETKTLTENIHYKETIIEDLFTDTESVKKLTNVRQYPLETARILNDAYEKNLIFVYIYENNNLIQWGTNIYVPDDPNHLNEGENFIYETNRYFIAVKKTIGSHILVALIPTKRNFQDRNLYLDNNFYANLDPDRNLQLADYKDTKGVENVYSKNGNLLFSVKFHKGKINNFFTSLEILMWIFGTIALISLIHNLCLWICSKGFAWSSIFLFAVFLALLRWVEFETNWLTTHITHSIFDPKNYALSQFFPNLGILVLIFILVFWLIAYAWSIRADLKISKFFYQRNVAIISTFILYLSIYIVVNVTFSILGTIISDSGLTTDLTQILGLTMFSWYAIFALCISTGIIIFYIDIIQELTNRLITSTNTLIAIHITTLFFSLLLHNMYASLNIANVTICLMIAVRSYNFKKNFQYKFASQILYLLFFSILASIKHGEYSNIKNTNELKIGIKGIEAEDDINAISLFMDIESEIGKDKQLQNYFLHASNYNDQKNINEYIRQKYISGYLAKFDYESYFYDANNQPLGKYSKNEIEEFRKNVIEQSIKVTSNFYRLKSQIGSHDYFAQFKIPYAKNNWGTVIVKLTNKSFSYNLSYPGILSEGRLNNLQMDILKKNSFVIYKDDEIIQQSGNFSYPLTPREFSKQKFEYDILEKNDGYIHMSFRPDDYTLIVMSCPKINLWTYLTTTSTIFIILFIFLAVSSLIMWSFKILKNRNFKFKNFKYSIYLLRNKVQYSSRIQTYFVITVILSLLFSGLISFISIDKQLEQNNENNRLQYIAEIGKRIELTLNSNQAFDDYSTLSNYLNVLSRSVSTDFTLYNKAGMMIYSSQPKIFDQKLLSKYINPNAFYQLSKLHKSEVLEQEQIGTFTYPSSYTVIKNNDLKTVAYLGIPFYSANKDSDINKNILSNTLINIYALILLIIGFIAAFLANKITEPLNIIKRKLSETSIDQNNEPIFWQRNDEIGALIKEYNIMILKLDDTAKKLVRAERENVWREMAQQVAHEIKNPLTPMKLGIQHLSRSFEANDPKFPDRFKQISTSFIEQIDSLTDIANEFSAFAKLPTAKLVTINILDKVSKSVDVYSNNPNVNIQIINATEKEKVFVMGDKGQLLRLFNNLIKNAIEAAISKKRITIQIIINIIPDHIVEIQVRDNGSGIPTDVQKMIFTPNFTTKSSGTGLGLAFVKQTVEGMGGDIDYETAEGKGTTFTIHVPEVFEAD